MPTPYFEQALGRFEEHVREFDSKYLSKGEIPKDYGFRPYRFCVRDAVLGLAVVKYGRREDLLVVDVCLTADPPQFPPHSGTKIVMISLLCEAFKCGAKLEIKFTENVEGGRGPSAFHGFDGFFGSLFPKANAAGGGGEGFSGTGMLHGSQRSLGASRNGEYSPGKRPTRKDHPRDQPSGGTCPLSQRPSLCQSGASGIVPGPQAGKTGEGRRGAGSRT